MATSHCFLWAELIMCITSSSLQGGTVLSAWHTKPNFISLCLTADHFKPMRKPVDSLPWAPVVPLKGPTP